MQIHLRKYMECCEEANGMHEAIRNLDLPEHEVDRQKTYFHAKRLMFSEFIENVKVWLSDAGQPYVQSNHNETDHSGNLSVASDEIHPQDSASNISWQKENQFRPHSQLP